MDDLPLDDGPDLRRPGPGADRLLDDVTVCWMTGLPRSTVIKLVGDGTFPAPVTTGRGGHYAWRLSEIQRWIGSLEPVPHMRRRA